MRHAGQRKRPYSPAVTAQQNRAALGNLLRQRRDELGLSIDALADAANVSRMTIIRWEQGATGFSLAKLQPVLHVLHIPSEVAIAVARGDQPEATLPPSVEAIYDRWVRLSPAGRERLDATLATVAELADWWISLERHHGTRQTG